MSEPPAAEFPKRFSLHLVALDPTIGSELQKTRPCVVVSPNELNARFRTVVIAPLTSQNCRYPFRVETVVRGVEGQVAIDQIRAVDRARLVKQVGVLDPATGLDVLQALTAFFAP